ncbi:hypothetical protein O1M63_36160 [Streptomyces mirabilis]|nr:hypothetical protein [Streptomyces mirabilis]
MRPRSARARTAPERARAADRRLPARRAGPDRLPASDWLWALREAGRTLPTADLDYGDPRGSRVLREVVAGYLRRVRAAAADPERIVVCSGYAQGLGLALESLAGAGCESWRTRTRAPRHGDGGRGRRGSDGGARPGRRAGHRRTSAGGDRGTGRRRHPRPPVAHRRRPRARTPARADRVGDAADAYVVEDDYDAEFRYDREPVGALQGLAADRVVSIGTVSKSLAPALRIGWLLCPPALTAPITATSCAPTAAPRPSTSSPSPASSSPAATTAICGACARPTRPGVRPWSRPSPPTPRRSG